MANGIGNIILGSTKEEIVNLLGEPDETSQDEWPDQTISDTWSYHELKMELSFYSDSNYCLTTITTTSDNVEFEGIKPIHLKEQQLVESFPSIVLDEDFEENGKDYIYPEKEISFWVVDGVVDNLTVFPKYDKTGNIPIWPNISC